MARKKSDTEAVEALEAPAGTAVEPGASDASPAPSEAVSEASETERAAEPELTVQERFPHVFKLQEIVPAKRKKDHRSFARVKDGVVLEIIHEVQNIEEEWHPDILKTFVEITDEEEKPDQNWTHKGKKFAKPEPDELTPAQRRRIALEVDGIDLKRKGGKPSKLKLTEPLWQRMTQIAQHASMFKELPDGSVKLPGEPPLEFSDADEFLATYKELSVLRERWNKHVDGQGEAPPSGDITV